MTAPSSLSRRDLISGGGAALAGIAGCTGLGLPSGSRSCRGADAPDAPGEIIASRSPKQTWKWGERIPDTEPSYEPRAVQLLNTGPTRQFTVVARRPEPTDPRLEKRVQLADREFAQFSLREPDRWTIEVTTRSGVELQQTVDTFDCNTVVYSLWVRCDGSVDRGGSATLVGCESYPVNETE